MATVTGTNNSETIDWWDGAGNSDDFLYGFAGDDVLFGYGGNDEIEGGRGADWIDGGADNDTASYFDSNEAVVVNLETGTGSGGSAEGDRLISIENLAGSAYADWLTGDAGNNVLSGWRGDDFLKGGGGDDTLNGGPGMDTLKGGRGADTLNGGSGIDTASYNDSNEAVVVSLESGQGFGGTAEGDQLNEIENLIGSAYDDALIGNIGNNVLSGLQGHDSLKGGGGADTLDGDSGNDTLKGGGGADTLNGGSGIDTAAYNDSAWGVYVSLYHDHAAYGDAAGDELNGIENVTGSAYDDTLEGDDGANVLKGMDDEDWLRGFGGNDTLYGGNHNDVLIGGAGADTMYGGAGADRFRFLNISDAPVAGIGFTDYVVDFSSAQLDKIDLSMIDADTSVGGDQAFSPIGINVAFNGVAGELRYNGGFLEGDVNGDAVADFRIQINTTLNASDLML